MSETSPYLPVITFIAGTVIGILGLYLTQLRFHGFAKSRDATNRYNNSIDEFCAIISGEIQRISGEKHTSTKAIGDLSVMTALMPRINAIITDDSRIDDEWKNYQRNEHRRTFMGAIQKKAALAALENLIHILNSHKK